MPPLNNCITKEFAHHVRAVLARLAQIRIYPLIGYKTSAGVPDERHIQSWGLRVGNQLVGGTSSKNTQ
jgi:hypothetical protein